MPDTNPAASDGCCFRRTARTAQNDIPGVAEHRPTIMVAMVGKVSTMEVRQRIGDMLNRVALSHDEFIIERKGKPLAALVPVERLEQMRRFARRHALEFMDQQQPSALTDAQASKLAADAKRWAR